VVLVGYKNAIYKTLQYINWLDKLAETHMYAACVRFVIFQ